MTNHENKTRADWVHLLMAFKRGKDGEKHDCLRMVIKDEPIDLAMLELKCKMLGGSWRIHKTVNARDTAKAMKWLQHKLLDFPEGAGFIDSLWRTALLQRENIWGATRFMLDIDSKDGLDLLEVRRRLNLSNCQILEKRETPKGWHYITNPFDVRLVCELTYVELKRDGYIFIKKIGEKNAD